MIKRMKQLCVVVALLKAEEEDLHLLEEDLQLLASARQAAEVVRSRQQHQGRVAELELVAILKEPSHLIDCPAELGPYKAAYCCQGLNSYFLHKYKEAVMSFISIGLERVSVYLTR